MPGILSGVGWCIEELRAPEAADRLPVAVEHVQHGSLVAFRGLAGVIAVVAVTSESLPGANNADSQSHVGRVAVRLLPWKT
jgi:hypothetical protein